MEETIISDIQESGFQFTCIWRLLITEFQSGKRKQEILPFLERSHRTTWSTRMDRNQNVDWYCILVAHHTHPFGTNLAHSTPLQELRKRAAMMETPRTNRTASCRPWLLTNGGRRVNSKEDFLFLVEELQVSILHSSNMDLELIVQRVLAITQRKASAPTARCCGSSMPSHTKRGRRVSPEFGFD